MTIEIDNTGDDAVMLSSAMLNITVDNSQFEIVSGDDTVTFDEIGKEIITKKYTFKAVPQTDLTAGGIYVSLTATANLEDGTQKNSRNGCREKRYIAVRNRQCADSADE